MTQVNCKLCQKEFYAKPSWLKKGQGIYCSAACHHSDARMGKMMTCGVCSEETYKSPKALRGSKSGSYFCSKSCQTIWRNTEFMGEKHANWKGGLYVYRRILVQSKKPQVCLLCSENDKRTLAAHHVDEDRNNNTIENLAWLCHNCHHLVHNYPRERERFMANIV